MLLNNEQMLPARIRKMRQMEELLNAENVILEEMEHIIDEMYQRASFLQEELINEIWIQRELESITGGIVYANKVENELKIKIIIETRQLSIQLEKIVIAFLNKWLPVHLKYEVSYGKIFCATKYYAALWQDDEIMMIRQVI